ncbi:T9SS type A sorting domain-containing protein [Lutibacter sp.]
MKKLYFLCITIFITSISFGQLLVGDISFVAFNADGDDDFAIVALADIPVNTTIYFTDNEPNATGTGLQDLNEGTISWNTGAAIISAGTVVIFTDTDSSGNPLFGASIGTLAYVEAALNLSSLGDALYAVLGDPTTDSTTTWLAGIQNEANNEGANFAATGLTKGTTFVEFYTSGSPDGGEYSGVRTGLINFSDYLAEIGNSANWTIENTDGELLLPLNTTVFTTSTASVVKNQIEGFSLYPNPVTNGKLYIKSNSMVTKNVEIYSMLGQQVYTKSVQPNEIIDVASLNRGIYMVRIEENGKIATRKLVIK